MANREEIINEYYNKYDEDNRLVKNYAHNLEFVITKNYLDKIIKEGNRVLELGAGTGRYSLYLASKGYDVTAIEYVQHNLEILKSHITSNMKIRAEQGDALDLSIFDDNTFDVTLVFGPLYHLYDDKDIDKAIKEAIRVTKKKGIIAIAYITSDGIMGDWGIDHLLDGYQKDFDSSFKFKRYPEEVFAPFYIEEFEKLMSNYNVTFLHDIATDGISEILSDKINNMSDEEYKMWIKYQLSVCERRDLQGYSCHMLYICEKNN